MVSDISRTDVCVSENRNIDRTAMIMPVRTVEDFGLGEEPSGEVMIAT